MVYSEISIVAPDSAPAGSVVSVEVKIKNLADFTISGEPLLKIDGVVSGEGSYQWITPGQVLLWYFTFIMPGRSVIARAESWIECPYFDIPWHLDAFVQKAISPSPTPTITDFKIVDYDKV